MFVMRLDKTFVTVAHPGILRRARVPRSALKHMSPGWRLVGNGNAPVTPRPRKKRTQRPEPGKEE